MPAGATGCRSCRPLRRSCASTWSPSGRFPDELLGALPPRAGRCTVEKLAINAVMAGAPAGGHAAALLGGRGDERARVQPLRARTPRPARVVPGVFVNGPARHELKIPYGPGCFGGEAGPGARHRPGDRLVMRNVGGQVVGESSKSVFGHPAGHRGGRGRVGGALAVGAAGRAPGVSRATRSPCTACTGTIDVADITATSGPELLQVIGTSLAFPGTNAFIGAHHGAEVLVAIAPPWVDLIARDVPDLADVQQLLWEHAALPVTAWPERPPAPGGRERPDRRRRARPPGGGARAPARDRVRRPRQPPRARLPQLRADARRDPGFLRWGCEREQPDAR